MNLAKMTKMGRDRRVADIRACLIAAINKSVEAGRYEALWQFSPDDDNEIGTAAIDSVMRHYDDPNLRYVLEKYSGKPDTASAYITFRWSPQNDPS